MNTSGTIGRPGKGRFLLPVAFSIVLGLSALVADACPVCGTQTGLEVRQAIFGQNFLRHAAWTLAPVPILLGTVATIYFGFPPRRSKKQGRS
jgi:hypothetical protein